MRPGRSAQYAPYAVNANAVASGNVLASHSGFGKLSRFQNPSIRHFRGPHPFAMKALSANGVRSVVAGSAPFEIGRRVIVFIAVFMVNLKARSLTFSEMLRHQAVNIVLSGMPLMTKGHHAVAGSLPTYFHGVPSRIFPGSAWSGPSAFDKARGINAIIWVTGDWLLSHTHLLHVFNHESRTA